LLFLRKVVYTLVAILLLFFVNPISFGDKRSSFYLKNISLDNADINTYKIIIYRKLKKYNSEKITLATGTP
jgi:hypothetical protein